jgi:hypothetical protein
MLSPQKKEDAGGLSDQAVFTLGGEMKQEEKVFKKHVVSILLRTSARSFLCMWREAKELSSEFLKNRTFKAKETKNGIIVNNFGGSCLRRKRALLSRDAWEIKFHQEEEATRNTRHVLGLRHLQLEVEKV